MDKELEQQAISTFVQQPEIYAEFLTNNGQDGSQIPVDDIKKDPDTYITAFQKDKKFHDTIVGLFQAIVKSQKETSIFREGGKFDYLNKLQKGGQITRKEMFEQAKINKGLNRSQAKKAYRNSRRAGLDRDAARLAVVGETPAVEESAILERSNLINNVPAPIKVSPPIDNLIVQREVITERPTTDYSNVDFGVFNFNDAFGRASKAGLKEFTWNGKKFTTNRALPALGPDGKNYSIGDTLLQNGNVSTPDWWISKQFEPTTVLSGNGINPWPAIHAREIHPPLKREGGKLSKENEANKKYIKASEKAGQEASKKMSDLKNKHKAELKKIRKGQEGLKTYAQRKYDEVSGPIRRGWNNFKQSAPGQVMGSLLPVQIKTTTTDANGNTMYAASPTFSGPKTQLGVNRKALARELNNLSNARNELKYNAGKTQLGNNINTYIRDEALTQKYLDELSKLKPEDLLTFKGKVAYWLQNWLKK